MFRIFNKEIIAKEIFNINLNVSELQEICNGNHFIDHPELKPEDHCIVEQEYPFEYPTYDSVEDTIREMTLIERYKNKLYELQKNEIEYKGDIVKLEPGQYLDTATNEIVTVEKIEGVRVEWNWDTHTWEDLATDIEIIDSQYNEYAPLDTPSSITEMNQLDPTLGEELMNMLIELRQLKDQLLKAPDTVDGFDDRVLSPRISIPQPSDKLKKFKDRFKNK